MPRTIACAALALLSTAAAAQAVDSAVAADAKLAKSPWMAMPTVSSNPKLGTSVGALGAYVFKFDPKSRTSLIGLTASYTSTQSYIGSAFARLSWDEDHQRLIVIGAFGHVNNDYNDYLGTGQPLKTTGELKALASRYLYRVAGDWFLGGQISAANFQVFGGSPEDDNILEQLGIKGFKNAGAGLVAQHDSRDSDDSPTSGWYLNANNVWYGDWFSGDTAYSAIRVDGRAYFGHGAGHVFAVRQNNWFTFDAPASAEASVILRGYKQGQYLGQYMSSIEVEERFKLARLWGATVFTGAAYLYGTGATGAQDENTWYPMYGLGVNFLLKPEARMVANLEYAHGNAGNYGIYLKLGYAY
jgi:hypothetical protein